MSALPIAVALLLGVVLGAGGMWEAHPLVASLTGPGDVVSGSIIECENGPPSVPLAFPLEVFKVPAAGERAVVGRVIGHFATRCEVD